MIIELNSRRISWGHQHGRRSIVEEHRDATRKDDRVHIPSYGTGGFKYTSSEEVVQRRKRFEFTLLVHAPCGA